MTALAGLMLGGCATAPPACTPPGRVMSRAELFFGLSSRAREAVSEAAFANFVAGTIAPRFPEGLTVVDAAGRWRDPANGRSIAERSKVVVILFDDTATRRDDLDAIAAAYKVRFAQRSVLVAVSAACARF